MRSAAAAVKAATDPRVTQVRICTPDKDLSQCVSGTRIVQEDRLRRTIRDEAGVIAKFGVPPASIPDYLALVGDSSDGYPGLAGWGAKSASAVLAKFKHLELIPKDWRTWGVNVARPGALSITLEKDRELALLFRDLATLRTNIPVFDIVDDLEWKGPTAGVRRLQGAVRPSASLISFSSIAFGVRPRCFFSTLPSRPIRNEVGMPQMPPVAFWMLSSTSRPASIG